MFQTAYCGEGVMMGIFNVIVLYFENLYCEFV